MNVREFVCAAAVSACRLRVRARPPATFTQAQAHWQQVRRSAKGADGEVVSGAEIERARQQVLGQVRRWVSTQLMPLVADGGQVRWTQRQARLATVSAGGAGARRRRRRALRVLLEGEPMLAWLTHPGPDQLIVVDLDGGGLQVRRGPRGRNW